MKQQFHDNLKIKMNNFVHLVYKITKNFPRDELYGVTSQLRRSALSIILNYIEGYARGKEKIYKNFLEISYGSTQETKYLLDFSLEEEYLIQEDYKKAINLNDEIGAMLWKTIKGLNK